MAKPPKVSVVMPAYNAEKYIAEAIESILNQTFRDFEFIIVDDGSTDRTWEIINDYASRDSRIVPLKNEKNLKIAKTLNYGISCCHGKYIARMDADDWSYPNRLEKQVAFMEKNCEIGISGGSMEIMDEEDRVFSSRRYRTCDQDIRKNIFKYSPFCHPSIIFRTDIFRKTDGYEHDYLLAEDYDLYFKLGRFCKFGNLEDTLLKYRLISGSMSRKKLWKTEWNTIRVRKKYFREYKGSLVDALYSVFQILSFWLIPPKIRVRLFTAFRKRFV